MQYTVQAASRATGVSPARLRTWERRYGIPRPARSATGRRLYEDDDIAVIRRMAALVEAGVPAAQAADAALAEVESGTVIDLPVAPAPEVDPLVVDIADAAERYDEPALVAAIDAAVDRSSWRGALGTVLFPALRLIGERWQRGELSPSAEHFASALARRQLLAAVAALPDPALDAPVAVLACPEDERHDLGATALWLLLREAGARVIFLGADVPTPELTATLRRTDAPVVSLSATAPNSLPMLGVAARALVAARVRARIFVGGPAFDDAAASEDVPGVRLPAPIGDAANTLIDALNGSTPGTNLTEDSPIDIRSAGPEVDA
jgi:DNA-binding transcriptional MerR regulator/methylmalonyl-CoA mutase cobalamin-binding subunit